MGSSGIDAPIIAPGRGRYDRGLTPLQRRELQRRRLVAATVRAVAELGVASTTVSRIVDLAGMGRNTFYEHFSDARSVVRVALDEAAAELAESIVEAASDARTPVERLRAIGRAWLAGLVRQSDLAPAILEALARDDDLLAEARAAVVASLVAALDEARRECVLTVAADPIRAGIAVQAMWTVGGHALERQRRDRAGNLPEVLVDVWLRLFR